MKKIVVFLLVGFILFACGKEDAVENFTLKTFIVASQKGIYTGWWGGTAVSLLVKENPADPFYVLGQDIEGFDYVAGFEYKIVVKEYKLSNPPADASSVRYVLKKIISKQ